MLKNVTITVEEDALRWAKQKAAQQETSVSRMVGKLLQQAMQKEDDFAESRERWLQARKEFFAEKHDIDASQRMSREEANTRPKE